MSLSQVGSCPHCGAPIYAPMFWQAVTPPPNTYTCSCMVQARADVYVTSTGTNLPQQ